MIPVDAMRHVKGHLFRRSSEAEQGNSAACDVARPAQRGQLRHIDDGPARRHFPLAFQPAMSSDGRQPRPCADSRFSLAEQAGRTVPWRISAGRAEFSTFSLDGTTLTPTLSGFPAFREGDRKLAPSARVGDWPSWSLRQAKTRSGRLSSRSVREEAEGGGLVGGGRGRSGHHPGKPIL